MDPSRRPRRHGGAQPLAAVIAGAHCIAIECRGSSIEKRLATRYLDHRATTIEEALAIVERATEPTSVGLLGNAAELVPEMLARNIRPDAITDQTSAHDPVNGYLPIGWTVAQWDERRVRDPEGTAAAGRVSMARHVEALLGYRALGVPVFDYGNNVRQEALDAGVEHAFDLPGFVPVYIRPLFCRGIGPFRWVALSGDPEDIYRTDVRVKELIPDDPDLHGWLDLARERIAFQGLPARICWVGLGQRHRLGLAFNEMVRNGEIGAPIVIGRDHLDSGSVASPNRETERMKDGSDAVSDWPLLNALLNTASGATWVSLHHGGGVGMGYSQHAGMVIVADGTDDAARRLERVLWNDPVATDKITKGFVPQRFEKLGDRPFPCLCRQFLDLGVPAAVSRPDGRVTQITGMIAAAGLHGRREFGVRLGLGIGPGQFGGAKLPLAGADLLEDRGGRDRSHDHQGMAGQQVVDLRIDPRKRHSGGIRFGPGQGLGPAFVDERQCQAGQIARDDLGPLLGR